MAAFICVRRREFRMLCFRHLKQKCRGRSRNSNESKGICTPELEIARTESFRHFAARIKHAVFVMHLLRYKCERDALSLVSSDKAIIGEMKCKSNNDRNAQNYRNTFRGLVNPKMHADNRPLGTSSVGRPNSSRRQNVRRTLRRGTLCSMRTLPYATANTTERPYKHICT
jgi:hypothetical protein